MDFNSLKNTFGTNYAPRLRKLVALACQYCSTFTIWATDYGEIAVDKILNDDTEFIMFITEKGNAWHNDRIPIITCDFRLKLDENKKLAKLFQEKYGFAYIDEANPFYRADFTYCEDIDEITNVLMEFVTDHETNEMDEETHEFKVKYTRTFSFTKTFKARNAEEAKQMAHEHATYRNFERWQITNNIHVEKI